MGGTEQARQSAKKLKSQVNERDTSELLFRLSKTATDEQVETTINKMFNNFIKYGML